MAMDDGVVNRSCPKSGGTCNAYRVKYPNHTVGKYMPTSSNPAAKTGTTTANGKDFAPLSLFTNAQSNLYPFSLENSAINARLAACTNIINAVLKSPLLLISGYLPTSAADTTPASA